MPSRERLVEIKTQYDVHAPSRTLARNTVSMIAGQGIKLVIQAGYFLMMARNLGPHQYGAFIAVTAAAAISSPFVGNGSGLLMIRNVARQRNEFPECWGNTLLMTLVSGIALSLGVIFGCLAFLPHSIPAVVIVLLVVSEVVLLRFVDAAGWAFQAVEELGWTAKLNVFATFTRLAGIAAIVILHRPTLMAWSVAYLVGSVVSGLVAIGCVVHYLEAPKLGLDRIRREWREGFYFSTSLSAQTIYNDVDKTMLARMATLDAAGIYAAGYRLIEVAFIPVRSLLAAAYPGFFRAGERGIRGSFTYAKLLLPRAAAYSAVAVLALLAAASLVPRFLGPEYARTAVALRWLALLPLLKTLHCFAADSLTGAGYQRLRVLLQVGVAIFNILLNLWLIPTFAWRGAAWASLASDGLLVIVLYLAVLMLCAKTSEAAWACERAQLAIAGRGK
jgi:O-antigen/teichoic acid export membrane protein